MKLKLVLLSLLVGSSAQAWWESPNLCKTKEARLFYCAVEDTHYSIDMCKVNNTDVTFVTSEGETFKGKHIRQRGENMIYAVEGTEWVITNGIHGGYCLIDKGDKVLRAESMVIYDNMLDMTFYDKIYAFWKSL